MKKILLFSIMGILCLVSCSTDDYVGDDNVLSHNGEINFSLKTAGTTRADKTGVDAGNLLNNFYILGTKGSEQTNSPSTTIVFDNYKVSYMASSAGSADDNTHNWRYVGITPTGLHAGTSKINAQSIKYWDYSANQYDFIAYSVGPNTLLTSGDASQTKIAGSVIKTPVIDDQDKTKVNSFTLKVANAEDLQKCYFTDVTPVTNTNYGKPVTLKFKSLSAKVRVAFYETIPGYSVSALEFFQNTTDERNKNISSNNSATLIGTSFPTAGTITVSYPKVGTDNTGEALHNKASIAVAPSGTNATIQQFGTVNYTDNKLATTATTASMAGTSDYYKPVFPVTTTPEALTLRVNYTLTSTDGSGETIKVYGAKAVVPASYCEWKPNNAYTYIFKISDNTNGFTSTTGDKEGLFPITFDAVVTDADGNQESITTVASPSITTYAFNNSTQKVIAANGASANEYPAATSTDIYLSVQNNNDLTNGTLYTISGMTAPLVGTESEVIDALQMGTTGSDNVITGRNGIKLTPTSPAAAINVTSLPTEDGMGITVSEKSVAKFTATATATTYAYVLDVTSGTPTATYIYTATPGDGTTVAGENEYYTDSNGTTAVASGTTLATGTIYYKKITNNNHTYAVKVIKTT